MASQHSRCRRTRGRAPALHLEELEDRTLLSVCTVDRLTDLGEGKEWTGDLRYCITQAQDGDSIQFAVKGSINLTRALPDLTRSISIDGSGADLLTVRRDTGGNYRIFKIPSGVTIGLSGLRIANGRHSDGGGIYNAGTLSISSSVVSENVVLADFVTGGGIANFGTVALSDSTVTRNVGGEVAGGIYNAGTMTISNSTVSDNQSYTVGGIANGDEGTLTVGNSTVSGNQGYGLWNSGTLMVTSSRISGRISQISRIATPRRISHCRTQPKARNRISRAS